MTRKTLNLTNSVYDYLLKNSLREPKVFTQLRERTALLPNAAMQISPEQAQFMAFLIELMQAKKTLELGVFTGYSAMAVAHALPKDGKLVACDVNKEWTDIAKEFWQRAGVANKIELHLAPAQDTLKKLIDSGQQNTFDFVFIDADKKGYNQYYELSLKLLKLNGVIMFDNVLLSGRVAEPNNQDENVIAMRALNEKILHDERVSITMLPIRDGITLVRKRV